MKDILASVDLGATKISVTLATREGVLFRAYQPVNLRGKKESIPAQITNMIDECIKGSDMKRDDLVSVGVSSSGPFTKVNGMIEIVSPNICGALAPERGIIPNDWDSVPLERELRRYFQVIEIDNDAVAGVVAERTFGKGRGYDNMLYVTWSTGIGTGAFVDGRLIRGKNRNAPHGGHLYLDPNGPVCGCGNIGDLESLASGTSIADSYGPDTSTEEVFDRYHENDERAIEIIDRAAFFFGRGLASLNAVLDTELITIGGGVFMNNITLLLAMVREEFYRSFPILSRDVEITSTGLGEQLGDLAALSLIIPEEWKDEWNRKRPWENGPDTRFLDRIDGDSEPDLPQKSNGST